MCGILITSNLVGPPQRDDASRHALLGVPGTAESCQANGASGNSSSPIEVLSTEAITATITGSPLGEFCRNEKNILASQTSRRRLNDDQRRSIDLELVRLVNTIPSQRNNTIASLIVDNGASTNANIPGETPLYIAVSMSDHVAVRTLLELGADPNSGGESKLAPLVMATIRNSEHVVRLLLLAGADAEAEISREAAGKIHRIGRDGPGLTCTPLLAAVSIWHGKQDVVKWWIRLNIIRILLGNGAKAGSRGCMSYYPDLRGRRDHAGPLLEAVSAWRSYFPLMPILEICRELIDHGANVTMSGGTWYRESRDPLCLAARGGHRLLFELLLSNAELSHLQWSHGQIHTAATASGSWDILEQHLLPDPRFNTSHALHLTISEYCGQDNIGDGYMTPERFKIGVSMLLRAGTREHNRLRYAYSKEKFLGSSTEIEELTAVELAKKISMTRMAKQGISRSEMVNLVQGSYT